MTTLPFTTDADDPAAPPLGLIVLQTDETIEPEFRKLFADHPSPIYASRVPSDPTVTTTTLGQMERDLPAAASLLPAARPYAAVAYACTAGTAVIGAEGVAELVRRNCNTAAVTNPLSAATAQAKALGVSEFALLSPYIEEVNETLRAAFAANGVNMKTFGTFGESDEATVVRISTQSVVEAATRMGEDPGVEAVFLSCTNLRTLAAIPQIAERVGKPVMSSNAALAWHLQQLAA